MNVIVPNKIRLAFETNQTTHLYFALDWIEKNDNERTIDKHY